MMRLLRSISKSGNYFSQLFYTATFHYNNLRYLSFERVLNEFNIRHLILYKNYKEDYNMNYRKKYDLLFNNIYKSDLYITNISLLSLISIFAIYKFLKKENIQNVHCCGIIAYVGNKDAQPFLISGIEILQNRGYDSCGMSTIDNSNIIRTTKFASKGSTCDCVDILKNEAPKNHTGHKVGIAHTRWATHGAKTDANAHPHRDYKNRISLVHNGTIENYASLKQLLLGKGIKFQTETDSEVIANLIGYYMDKGFQFEVAVRAAVNHLQGTWGLAIICKDLPDRIVLCRNGSPLLVGCAESQVFVASEAAALARHTNQYLALKDGEIAVISNEGIDQLFASRPLLSVPTERIETSPKPYEHWTIKEIFEQPQSLARALNYGGRISAVENQVKLGGLDSQAASILHIENLIICGCGTSFYAGLYGELIMQWLTCFDNVKTVDASEMDIHALPRKDGGVLLVSQSGETLDTVRACQLAEEHGIKKLSIVNTVGSLLARSTGCGVHCNAGREVGVASTKAFTSQVTILALIGAWYSQKKKTEGYPDRCNLLTDSIQRLPVYAGMTLNTAPQCKEIAKKIYKSRSLFVLGKGFGYPAALEGALKIKEISYLHAEGYAAGALKHGPFALIDEKEKTPVILIILDDHHNSLMITTAKQLQCRGAHLICITDDRSLVKDLTDDIIEIPRNGPMTALLTVIPLQLIAYYIALEKGLNPDKPRGLAKTITVP